MFRSEDNIFSRTVCLLNLCQIEKEKYKCAIKNVFLKKNLLFLLYSKKQICNITLLECSLDDSLPVQQAVNVNLSGKGRPRFNLGTD